MVWESLLTLSGGGRVPWSWSSFFPGGEDAAAPLPEGNSGRFMAEVVDGEEKKIVIKKRALLLFCWISN